MRQTLFVGLIFSSTLAASGADRPIPQDAARMEKRASDRLEWNRRTLRGAYDKLGEKNARWDATARTALDLAARLFSQQSDPVVTLADVHGPAKASVDAGCKDPLILYLYARSSTGAKYPGEQEFARRLRAASDAMKASKYSPYRQAVAMEKALELDAWKKDLTPGDKLAVQRGLDALFDLLPRSLAEDARTEDWEFGWYNSINAVIALHRKVGDDYKTAFDRVDARLAKVDGIEALRLTVKGAFLLNWGWEARTNAVAQAVTEEQFRTFQSRLEDARASLEAAWKAKPGQPKVADLMLVVEKGIGGGDREAMETWFERAMTSDGNDQDACWSKLEWLDPKWYGADAPGDMLAFGKACRATKNWKSGITLLAADAHLRYYLALPPDQKSKYMGAPEVWAEIKDVYDEYLGRMPQDDVQRSKYAVLAFVCERYPEAHSQFQSVGDRLTTWPSAPMTLDSIKRMRDRTAQIMAGKRVAAPPAPKGGGRIGS